jgi:hypothetical protein
MQGDCSEDINLDGHPPMEHEKAASRSNKQVLSRICPQSCSPHAGQFVSEVGDSPGIRITHRPWPEVLVTSGG